MPITNHNSHCYQYRFMHTHVDRIGTLTTSIA